MRSSRIRLLGLAGAVSLQGRASGPAEYECVESLDGEGVRTAVDYWRRVPPLSLVDCSALTFANVNGWTLLAGDGALCHLADAEGVNDHGVLRVMDQWRQNGVSAETGRRAA
ncbi:MAG TPA: hypothetical protein VMU81_15180 [Acetobacteraceae bacterium]|nr:hypothetical protein [Acetobacteraceae bacterium]